MKMDSRFEHFVKTVAHQSATREKNRPDKIHIGTMLLENQTDLIVKYHLWTKSQLPGIIIDENVQKFPEG